MLTWKDTLSALAMLALTGCPSAPDEEREPAFLVDALKIPATTEEVSAFGQDYNQDGQVDSQDNALSDFAAIPDTIEVLAALVGLDIRIDFDLQESLTAAIQGGGLHLGVQIEERLLDGAGVFTIFLAALANGDTAPAFDGSDELAVMFPLPFAAEERAAAEGLGFQTEPGDFFLVLPFGEEASLLPLHDTIFAGTLLGADAQGGFLAGAALDGSLAGTLRASDFATQLGDLGATLGSQLPGLLALLDANGNGALDAIYDPARGVFVENELSLLFDIDADGGPPSGLLGELFRLDRDGDGVAESMGIGMGFSSVPATIPR